MLRTVIVCLGDSLTYGSRDVPEGYGYPARLELLVAEETGYPCLCLNKGITRETTTDIARRAFDTFRAYPESTLALVLAGTNDCKAGYNGDVFDRNMRQIINAAKCNGKRIILGKIPPIRPFGMWSFPMDVEQDVVLVNLHVERFGCQTVDFSDMDEYLVDGVHFGPAGYVEMARRWFRAIKEGVS